MALSINLFLISTAPTAQKMKFSIKNFFSKCLVTLTEEIVNSCLVWSILLKKSLMENFIFFYSDHEDKRQVTPREKFFQAEISQH